jgi:hypothetical protein
MFSLISHDFVVQVPALKYPDFGDDYNQANGTFQGVNCLLHAIAF